LPEDAVERQPPRTLVRDDTGESLFDEISRLLVGGATAAAAAGSALALSKCLPRRDHTYS
jgi:hypothetical protein